MPKPMPPIDRRIHIACAALAGARRTGEHEQVQLWHARIDELLDQKFAEMTADALRTA